MVLEAMFCCRFSAKWWLGVNMKIDEIENILEGVSKQQKEAG